MKKVETVLVGATFFSVGYACEHTDDCLILERKTVTGSEFAASLLAKPVRKSSDEFYSRLSDLKIIGEDGGIQTVPCAFALSRYILEKKINILLETEALSVQKNNDGYEVTVFNRGGMQKIKCKRVIDTAGEDTYCSFRTLGAILENGNTAFDIPENVGFVLYERSNKEPVLHLRLADGDDMVAAREKMRKFIDCGKFLGNWQIAAVASEIAYHYDSAVCFTEASGVRVIPSASYGDLISAMEGGRKYAFSDNC